MYKYVFPQIDDIFHKLKIFRKAERQIYTPLIHIFFLLLLFSSQESTNGTRLVN